MCERDGQTVGERERGRRTQMIHELMAAVKASVRLSFAFKDPERTSACSGLQINMPPICDSPLMCVCVRLRVCACMCVGVPASTP